MSFCFKCDGTGQMKCRVCNGTGYLIKSRFDYVEPMCYSCDTSGTETCDECGGSGEVEDN